MTDVFRPVSQSKYLMLRHGPKTSAIPAMMGSAEFDTRQSADLYFDRTGSWLYRGISADS
ncbi:MAG: hypothetical protein ACT6RN_15705 [Agrobacterium sp.]|uniref:hypothetical protein n=1 Tax=Agrobacterium sp. TaxID=361 RepID=UPI0040379A2E